MTYHQAYGGRSITVWPANSRSSPHTERMALSEEVDKITNRKSKQSPSLPNCRLETIAKHSSVLHSEFDFRHAKTLPGERKS